MVWPSGLDFFCLDRRVLCRENWDAHFGRVCVARRPATDTALTARPGNGEGYGEGGILRRDMRGGKRLRGRKKKR